MTQPGSAPTPASSPITAPPFPLARSTVALAVTLLVGSALVFAALLALGEDVLDQHGWSALLLGGGTAAGSWLALVLLARAAAALNRPGPGQAAGAGVQGLVTAALAGFLIRAVAALGAAVAAVAAFGAERRVAAAWLLGWYAVFLVVDVTILRRFFRLLGPASAGVSTDLPDAD